MNAVHGAATVVGLPTLVPWSWEPSRASKDGCHVIISPRWLPYVASINKITSGQSVKVVRVDLLKIERHTGGKAIHQRCIHIFIQASFLFLFLRLGGFDRKGDSRHFRAVTSPRQHFQAKAYSFSCPSHAGSLSCIYHLIKEHMVCFRKSLSMKKTRSISVR